MTKCKAYDNLGSDFHEGRRQWKSSPLRDRQIHELELMVLLGSK